MLAGNTSNRPKVGPSHTGGRTMARWTKRKMVWNEEKRRFISPLTGRTLTKEQYEARCAQGRVAAAASKALGEYMRTDEYKQEVDAIVERSKANAGRMRPLPNTHE